MAIFDRQTWILNLFFDRKELDVTFYNWPIYSDLTNKSFFTESNLSYLGIPDKAYGYFEIGCDFLKKNENICLLDVERDSNGYNTPDRCAGFFYSYNNTYRIVIVDFSLDNNKELIGLPDIYDTFIGFALASDLRTILTRACNIKQSIDLQSIITNNSNKPSLRTVGEYVGIQKGNETISNWGQEFISKNQIIYLMNDILLTIISLGICLSQGNVMTGDNLVKYINLFKNKLNTPIFKVAKLTKLNDLAKNIWLIREYIGYRKNTSVGLILKTEYLMDITPDIFSQNELSLLNYDINKLNNIILGNLINVFKDRNNDLTKWLNKNYSKFMHIMNKLKNIFKYTYVSNKKPFIAFNRTNTVKLTYWDVKSYKFPSS